MKWHVCEETLLRFQNTLQLEIHKGTASLSAEDIEAGPGGSHLRNLEDHTQNDSVADRTCSRFGEQNSGRSKWQKQISNVSKGNGSLETFSDLPVRL